MADHLRHCPKLTEDETRAFYEVKREELRAWGYEEGDYGAGEYSPFVFLATLERSDLEYLRLLKLKGLDK